MFDALAFGSEACWAVEPVHGAVEGLVGPAKRLTSSIFFGQPLASAAWTVSFSVVLCVVFDQLTLCFAISSRTSGTRSTGTSIAV